MLQFLGTLKILSFKGNVGKAFKVACENALKLGLPNLKQTENEKLCVICLENKPDTCLIPCGHFNYCQICESKISSCSICREPKTKKIKPEGILDTCLLCSKGQANMLATSCRHVVSCEHCRSSKSKASCPFCLQKQQRFLKIYF